MIEKTVGEKSMQLSTRGHKIEASATLRIKERALTLRKQGMDVIDLTAGEPDFPTPAHVCQAAIRAIEQGATRYTPNAGIPELREAIAARFLADNNLEYQPSQILVSSGAKHSIINALLALINSGDEVLIPSPYWVSYPQQVKLGEGNPVIIDTSGNENKITPELLSRHITSRTKILIMNSPANPTGIVYSREEIEQIMEFLRSYDLWVISDEIYDKIIFDNLSHYSPARYPGALEKTIVINGVSKAYAMTGWRIGYAAGPKSVIQAMSKIQSHFTSNASSVSQHAALAALTGPQECVEEFRQTFESRRNKVLDLLEAMPGVSYIRPQGGFYIFVNLSFFKGKTYRGKKLNSASDLCELLVEEKHVITVPGSAFGAPDFIRMSISSSSEVLQTGLDRMKQLFQELSN